MVVKLDLKCLPWMTYAPPNAPPPSPPPPGALRRAQLTTSTNYHLRLQIFRTVFISLLVPIVRISPATISALTTVPPLDIHGCVFGPNMTRCQGIGPFTHCI